MRSILLFYCTILGTGLSHAMEKKYWRCTSRGNLLVVYASVKYEFNGQLDLSIQVFKGIIIVYLCCNSFLVNWTWIAWIIWNAIVLFRCSEEGNVNSERLIQMMNVVDDVLVIEEKIYSVEKFLMSRRLMYWQAICIKPV
jgi:hypothetical protein